MGLSTKGNISLGIALVWGKNLVPNPAAAITAFRTLVFVINKIVSYEFFNILLARQHFGSIINQHMSNNSSHNNHPAQRIVNSNQELMEIALLAEFFHSDESAYHNFGHPLDTLLYAENEINNYELNEQIELPRLSIYKGLLLHDALVHLPLENKTLFATKEHRSANLAGYILSEFGESDDSIKNIKKWIINTNVNYPCDPEDDSAKIFCRSDIGNTADKIEIFVLNYFKVYKESVMEKRKYGNIKDIVDPLQAVEPSISFLKKYFRQDLTLGRGDWDKDKNGICKFVARATHNFLLLPDQLMKTSSS